MAQHTRPVCELVGRRITHVVVKESDQSPKSQVFLVLDDNTYLEFYSDTTIQWTDARYDGGLAEARSYLAPAHRIIIEA